MSHSCVIQEGKRFLFCSDIFDSQKEGHLMPQHNQRPYLMLEVGARAVHFGNTSTFQVSKCTSYTLKQRPQKKSEGGIFASYAELPGFHGKNTALRD